jgi:hypothetical protein
MRTENYIFSNNNDFYTPDGEKLPDGQVVVNNEINVAFLKCPCGCGELIGARLKEPHPCWKINGNTISPSINCINLPCKSHFNVTNGKVIWS